MDEAIDTAPLGVTAAMLMEKIEEEAERQGVVPSLGTVAIVVELGWPPGEDGISITEIMMRCNDARGWVQKGILEAGRDVIDIADRR